MVIKEGKVFSNDDNVNKNNKKRKIIGWRVKPADWEERYQRELARGDLVIIKNENSIDKKSITSVKGSIYDEKLGELPDTDKDIREYSCECGELCGNFFRGRICPKCGTEVIDHYGADIRRVGWISIEPFSVIEPKAFEDIGKIVGKKKLKTILDCPVEIDLNGNLVETNLQEKLKKQRIVASIFDNIGMIEFMNNFETIISYFADMKGMTEEAKYLIENKHRIFTSHIAVSSIYLRPTFTSSKKRSVSYDAINPIYIKILTDSSLLKRTMKNNVDIKRALKVLYDIQMSLAELYLLVIKSKLSGKTKLIRRNMLGCSMNFSSRMIIRSYVSLTSKADCVEISYKAYLELFLLEIINMLMKGYGGSEFMYMTVYEVYAYVQKCQYKNEIDPVIWKVMQIMLKYREYNDVAINRPPTFCLGSIQSFIINSISPDATDKTLALPLGSLQSMNADFDGDQLSTYAPKEKCVIEAFREGISPKRLIIDCTGDSYFNKDFGLIKDEFTNLISMLSV